MKAHCCGLVVALVSVVFFFAASTAFGGPAAYWSFDTDFTSAGIRTGMDGTAVENSGGSVTIGTGAGEYKVGGGALKINDPPGTGKNALLIDAAVYEGTLPPATQTITLCGWYKPTDVGGDGSDPWLYIWESNTAFTVSVSISTTDSDPTRQNPRWAYSARNNYNSLVGPEYNHSDWNHVVTVFNSTTKRAKFYHNGVFRDYRAIPDDVLNTLSASTQFYIGTSRNAYTNRNFDGYIDEVALFDYEPAPAVLQGLYDGTYTPATAPSDAATPVTPNIRPGWSVSNTLGFLRPNGMAINPIDGKLYAAARGNLGVSSAGTVHSNVYAIESDGSKTPLFNELPGEPDRPYGLVIDSAGGVFYSEDYAGTIYKYDPLDPFDPRVPWVTDLAGDGSDTDPGAMAIVPATFNGGVGSLVHPGDALVVDYGSGGYEKIYVWSTSIAEGEWVLHDDTDPADGVGSPLFEPHGLAVSNSAIYVSDWLGDAIYTVSPVDGSLTQLTTSRPIVEPLGMAVDPVTGDLYVMTDDTEKVGSELVKINPATGQVSTVIDMLTDMDKFCETWPMMVPQILFSADGSHLYVVEPDADTIYDLTRSAVPNIPGDADHDGDVDQADAEKVALHWGEDYADCDFDNDGIVGPGDVAIVAANWGYGVEAEGSGAVPEPSTLVALLGILVALLLRRH